MKVIGEFLRLELVFILFEAIRRNDDVALPLGKRRRVILLTAATAATTALLTLVVLLAERTDFDEVHVGLDDVRRIPCIDSLSVIRHKIAGLQIELFQEERVTA